MTSHPCRVITFSKIAVEVLDTVAVFHLLHKLHFSHDVLPFLYSHNIHRTRHLTQLMISWKCQNAKDRSSTPCTSKLWFANSKKAIQNTPPPPVCNLWPLVRPQLKYCTNKWQVTKCGLVESEISQLWTALRLLPTKLKTYLQHKNGVYMTKRCENVIFICVKKYIF